MMTAYVLSLFIFMMLLLFAYMNRDSEFAYATAQCLASWMNTDKPARNKFENVFFEIESGGISNANPNGEIVDDRSLNASGKVDVAARLRGFHATPVGNDKASDQIIEKMGVNGATGEYAGFDQVDPIYCGAEKTFNPYEGYKNALQEPAEERVLHISKHLTKEEKEEIRRYEEQIRPATVGETLFGFLMIGGIAAVIWLIAHFLF